MEENTQTPKCISMIMDGNRRWAKERGLFPVEGHAKGYEKLKEVIEWTYEAGVPNLIVYAFSTENWNRAKEEVSYLMTLIRKVLVEQSEEFNKKGNRIVFAGDIERFPKDIQKLIHESEEKTKNNTGNTLVLCISYSGRTEILHAVNNLLKGEKTSVNEEEFSQALWIKDVPDPDIIIRTGGEKRLSGFLTWQSVYSELFFPKTFWPAFSKEEFLEILREFSFRDRRRGK